MKFPYIKTENEISKIEKSCRIVAETLTLIGKYMVAGTETMEIDRIAEDFILSKGAKPAFKGYVVDGKKFPYTLCISINDEVVHGMPGRRKLEEGQIASIDCGAELDGYFGDSAVTYAVGNVTEEKLRLMSTTQEALMLGIEKAVSKNKVYDISRAIQEFVEGKGYSVTRELVGHGIGKNLHEEPPVPNFVPPLLHRSKYPNIKLEKGMALAIEPMVHQGTKFVKTEADGWTVRTVDGKPAAHFEHTVIVDDNYPLILTVRD
ncbi:MAG: type I methionyl aminopeptidase [Bacteroidetes bacterium]|nr:MAG: type I methionyl aminopeptidase [Bacteroidota bacterium]